MDSVSVRVRAAAAKFRLLDGAKRVAVAKNHEAASALIKSLVGMGRADGFDVVALENESSGLDALCGDAAALGCDTLAVADTLDDAVALRYAGAICDAPSPLEIRGSLRVIRPLILTRAADIGIEGCRSAGLAAAARSLDSAGGYSAIYPETERAIRRAFALATKKKGNVTMNEITIRRALTDDIPQLDKLLFQVHRVHSGIRPDLFVAGAKKYTDGELAEIISDDTRPIFVAERDGKVIGYAFCVLENYGDSSRVKMKTLYIDDLCVDENARGTHAGTRLYEHVCDFARAEGCYNVTLNVWAGNDSAEGFYRHLGMKVQKTGMETIL